MAAIYHNGKCYSKGMVVDAALSITSDNPLKNKEIANIFDKAIAPIEESISLHAYDVGDQLLYNGILYTATDEIDIGDSLVVETNIEPSDDIVKQIASAGNGAMVELTLQQYENLTPEQKADPDKYYWINDVSFDADTIRDIVAPTESVTALANRAVGDEFILGEYLYKAISAISQGDSIVTSGAGQNAELAGTIVSQLKALLSALATTQGDVSTLQSSMSTAQSNISTLQSNENILKRTGSVEISDFDTVIRASTPQMRCYAWNSTTLNRPFDTWGTLLQFDYSTSSCIQIAFTRTGNIAIRNRTGSGWSSWQYAAPPPLNTLITQTSDDFTTTVAAASSVKYTDQTITKSGYTAVMGVVEGKSYADYATFSQTWTLGNGSAKVTGYVGNWSSTQRNVTLCAKVLWIKNDMTTPT